MVGRILEGGFATQEEVLRGLLDVGAKLYACRDRQEMLDTILAQARALTRAEAGSLYLIDNGHLRFVAVQNDRLDTREIARHLLGQKMPLSMASLSGYVALTGNITDIPDSACPPPGVPFQINRDFDDRTGYRVTSILAIPLSCPDGECVGVLQLLNRIDEQGRPAAFLTPVDSAVISLASTAATALHNFRLQEELRRVHLNTIFCLSTVAEYRDADTGEHIQRVSRVSELLAERLGMSGEQTQLIRYASPMHDVGKVAIPDAILLKPGHLTADQRRTMERHTVVGAEIFNHSEDDVLVFARDIALSHHERWDGQGYPQGIRGEQIPLTGRIVALADVFDAVVSRRCYKEACSLDVAMDILDKDTGKHFDPNLVKVFLDALDDVLVTYPTLRAA